MTTNPPDTSDSYAHLRVPPHSMEAETSLLGGLMMKNGLWDVVGDLLIAADFYRSEHRLIYEAIGALITACKPADVITVYEALQRAGKDGDAGGLAYLNALTQHVPSTSNARTYATIVRENSLRRKMITAADEIATRAFNPQGDDLEQMLDKAQGAFVSITDQRGLSSADEWHGMDQGMVALLDRIQSASDPAASRNYIPTGLNDLDERLDGGMRPGDFIVIGMRSGHGKSALSKTIGLHVALNEGLPVGEFSMEMEKSKQHNRMFAQISRVHLSRINRPERLNDSDWPRITHAVETLRNVQYDITDKGNLTINEIRARARSLKRKRGRLGLLIVDHLQLIRGTDPRAPRTYQLAEGSRGLKALAKELDCPIIGLAQINRGVDKEVDPMPRLSDLADSGSIEQDADIIILGDRPKRRQPDLAPEWDHYTRINVAKVRDGTPGFMALHFDGPHTYFESWPADLPIPSNKVRVARTGRENFE